MSFSYDHPFEFLCICSCQPEFSPYVLPKQSFALCFFHRSLRLNRQSLDFLFIFPRNMRKFILYRFFLCFCRLESMLLKKALPGTLTHFFKLTLFSFFSDSSPIEVFSWFLSKWHKNTPAKYKRFCYWFICFYGNALVHLTTRANSRTSFSRALHRLHSVFLA